MSRLRVGVMGCSSFAQRAMIPALLECDSADLVCVASRTVEKATQVAAQFSCDAIEGYDALLERVDVDAVYMPLPTGLHEQWCTKALHADKHLLVEKSFATNRDSAERMLGLARRKNRLVMENFQFQTHGQWSRIVGSMTSGELGEVHLVRSTFGFPPLPRDNFRWSKELGGGALLDAGAYTTMVAALLLGPGLDVLGGSLQLDADTGVDVYGEAMLRNKAGQVAQVAFGFDYFYQCRLELLGTKGKLTATRVFTTPPGEKPIVRIETEGGVEPIPIPADNHFVNMWDWFAQEVNATDHSESWEALLDQARVLNLVRKVGEKR